MKKFLLVSALAFLPMQVAPAFADGSTPNDHTGGGRVAITNDSYSLADAGEGMARQAQYYNYQIANAAQTMHQRASDLYWASRGGRRPGFPGATTNRVDLADHNEPGGDDIEFLHAYFHAVEDAYYRLQVTFRDAGGYQDQRLAYYMQIVDQRYQKLAFDFQE